MEYHADYWEAQGGDDYEYLIDDRELETDPDLDW